MLPLVPGFTNSIGMDLALIPAGTFLMGSSAEEPHHENDEGPQHWVHLTRPYYLSRTTITQRQYRHVLRRNPSTYNSRNKGGGRHPVERVTFGDAQRFCHMLSAYPEEQKQGRRYRLPTEAEWEHACRAGTTTPYSCGDTLTPSLANYDTNDHTLDLSEMRAEEQPLLRTCPVAQYPPNPWGLYDMHGNVWEWCADWFDNYLSDEQTDPTGPETNSEWDLRVIRGGGWNSYGRWCRSARRSNTNDDTEDADLGFRVVCVIES
jgi:formylglycine-generating enzyme required for sulfatase activity